MSDWFDDSALDEADVSFLAGALIASVGMPVVAVNTGFTLAEAAIIVPAAFVVGMAVIYALERALDNVDLPFVGGGRDE